LDCVGTWMLKEMGDPLEGLGKGSEMIITEEIVGV
jgi:hypothetical protein